MLPYAHYATTDICTKVIPDSWYSIDIRYCSFHTLRFPTGHQLDGPTLSFVQIDILSVTRPLASRAFCWPASTQ